MHSESIGELRPSRRTFAPGGAPAADVEVPVSASASLGDLGELAPLRSTLDRLVRLIEDKQRGMRGSILLLDDDGITLRHGAAPHLPPEYCALIDGERIGPMAGSCGTAAYRGEQVIVVDIATDPLWEAYRAAALPFGLRACWSTPILDADREVLGTFAMYYDEPRSPSSDELRLTSTAALLACNIIVRARAEEALRRRKEELRRRTEAAEHAAQELAESEARMRAARAEAEHANHAKAEFLAMMSHELRTPLNAIGGYAKLMLDGIPTPPSEGQQKYLQRIIKGQQHLLGLIESVLTHAKLEAGRMTYRMSNIRMSELLDIADSLMLPQMSAKSIAYDCSECRGSLVLRGDREKTAQILLNLLSNAVKFTPPHGRVTVRTEVVSPGRAIIRVRDTGIGMSPEQVATIFEPFVQFDNRLSREAQGTGLGMPISRELARGMGGDLSVQSALDQGTEFALTLPMDDAASQLH